MIVKFTEYAAEIDFFIDFIQNEINARDLTGVTGGRIEAINVTEEHPFVQLTGAIMQNPESAFNEAAAGILPAISVVEGDENETNTTMGQGFRQAEIIDESTVDDWKQQLPDIKERSKEAVLTNAQMDDIKTIIRGSSNGKILMKRQVIYLMTDNIISLWTEQIKDRRLIGYVLRSIIYDMRKAMLARSLKDINVTSSRGLNNFQFGRKLYGQETSIKFINTFATNTIDGEEPLPSDIDLPVGIKGGYVPAGKPEDPPVIIWEE